MKVFFLIVLLLVTGIMLAQRPVTGLWLSTNIPVNLDKHWQWHHDAGYRTFGATVQPAQFLYRTGARYRFNALFNAAAGVAFFATKTDFVKTHHEFGKEFRLWQELNLTPELSKSWTAQVRLRTEQRFFAATSSKEKYKADRFRLRAALTKRLAARWSVQAADEYMRQLVKGKLNFDQNRVMLTGIYHSNKNTQWQAGYMWLQWPADHQHIVLLTFLKTILHHGE